MLNKRTLIIDDAIPYAKAIFSPLGKVITLPGENINATIVKNVDVLIVRSRTQVNESLLKNSSVKFVGSTVVGLDHIDKSYLANNNIHFYSAQGCNANSVAEFVITVLFDLAESLNFNLTSKTIGIIGVGHIGKLVHKKAQILGIKCLLNDPPRERLQMTHKKSREGIEEIFCSLEVCLQADILTFHTPLTKIGTDSTYHLLSKERLAKIKPEQIIINTARGGIINEQAWYKTPTKANIIDCWENEPNILQPLYETAFLATPHIAGHSLDAKVAGSEMVYKELCAFWKVKPQFNWQQILPPLPEVIKLQKGLPEQASISEALSLTHAPRFDGQAIQSKILTELSNKYELYRRNFPIYREWEYHTINKNNLGKVPNILNKLGFSLTEL